MLAVGGTRWKNNVETAARNFSSGGRFFGFFPRLDHQKADVQAYIRDHVPAAYDGKYNKTSRAYPDIALASEALPQVGPTANRTSSNPPRKGYNSFGTSGSAPMFAALLSQLNDYRSTRKLPSLNFVNPRFHTDPKVRAAFKDITIGSNPRCLTTPSPGFTAEKGWDPVTGPEFTDFVKLCAALST